MASGNFSRREFLAALAAPAVRRHPVIDSHMHVWSMDTARYPFNPPEPNYSLPKDDGSLEDMVRRYPKLKVVVDHLGRPEILNRPPWVENDYLLKLAPYPNVSVKFTELYTASKTKVYPYKDVQPFGRMVYEKFGPKRLLFGTGMVGVTRRIPLADELRLIREDIPFFADRDKEWILGRNALKIWRWKTS